MVRLTLALLALYLPLVAQSTDARSAWASISANLIASAEKMPEADYAFQAAPRVRTFAQLIGHVADAQFLFCAPLLPDSKPRSGAEKFASKAELLAALKDSANFCNAAADRLTDDDRAPVKFFGRERAKLSLLWANIAHSNEHYGNIVTYLRLKGIVPPSSDRLATRARVYYDKAHGESGPPAAMAEVASRAAFSVNVDFQAITPDSLRNARLLYLRTPTKAFAPSEKEAIVAFVKAGGSLLVVMDEERGQSLAGPDINELLQPFGLKMTADTPYVHNCGAIANAGEINRADRELPYSGGRAVEGGTPFAYQLGKDGKPAQTFAAWKKTDAGGRIVVMAEAMASLFLGEKGAERLSGVPRDFRNTKYWGPDSEIFMEEVLAWLVKK